MSNTLNIAATFPTLSAAVESLGWDLSYNEKEGRRKIDRIEEIASSDFYLTEEGRIFYVLECDTMLLNEFARADLFSSCIHDGLFRLAEIAEDKITFSDAFLPRTEETRRSVKGSGLMLSLAPV